MWVLDVFRSVSKGVALLLSHKPKRIPKLHRLLPSTTYPLFLKSHPNQIDYTNNSLFPKYLQSNLNYTKHIQFKTKHLIQDTSEGFKAICKHYLVNPKPKGPQAKYFKLGKDPNQTIACFTLVILMQHRIAMSRIIESIQSIFSELVSSSEEGIWSSVVTTHSSVISDMSDLEDEGL